MTLALDAWLEGAAVVFHQAAQPGVRGSWGRDFAVYVHHNILGTQCLLEACARTGVRRLVARAPLAPRHRLWLAADVLARFGVRDSRRLAAEAYHSGRILASRAMSRAT